MVIPRFEKVLVLVQNFLPILRSSVNDSGVLNRIRKFWTIFRSSGQDPEILDKIQKFSK